MKILDERILESLSGEDTARANEIQQSLTSHEDATMYSQTEIDTRLDLLDAAGLVEQVNEQWSYQLTQRGVLYLRGEFNAAVISVETSVEQPNLVDRVDD